MTRSTEYAILIAPRRSGRRGKRKENETMPDSIRIGSKYVHTHTDAGVIPWEKWIFLEALARHPELLAESPVKDIRDAMAQVVDGRS